MRARVIAATLAIVLLQGCVSSTTAQNQTTSSAACEAATRAAIELLVNLVPPLTEAYAANWPTYTAAELEDLFGIPADCPALLEPPVAVADDDHYGVCLRWNPSTATIPGTTPRVGPHWECYFLGEGWVLPGE